MPTTETPSADTFVISLPEEWSEVSMEPERLVETVRERVRSLHPDEADSLEFRRTLVLLRRLAEQVQHAGVVFAAASSESVPSTADDDETAYFLTAFAYMATKKAETFGTDRVTFEQVQAAVEPEPTKQGVSRVERPRVLDLPAGPTVRDVTVEHVDTVDLPKPVDVLGCRYHLVIGDGEGMAVLGFVTPNVELVDELLELFHAIAATLEFVAA